MKPYEDALKVENDINDLHNWQLGQYIASAIQFALSKDAKYPTEPLFSIKDKEMSENTYKESREEIAIFEMKQRIEMLRKQGLPESPL